MPFVLRLTRGTAAARPLQLLRGCRSLQEGRCFGALASASSAPGAPQRALRSLPSRVSELAQPTLALIEQAKSLHPAFYVDEAYMHAERKHIFGTHWFAAAHTSELSRPGDVKVVEVGGTSIVITHDNHGKLNAFYNACRHQGERVCSSSATGCKQLVCPRHWRTYCLDGSAKSTPLAPDPNEESGGETLGLRRVPGVETFAGMVFLNQASNPPPLADTLGDLPDKLARYDLAGMQLHDTKDYAINGDWKLVAENFVDFYNISAVHPELARFSKVDDHLPYQGRGQYIGFVTAPLTDSGSAGDSYHFNAFPRLRPQETRSALFFHIFPNVSITIYPHSVYTQMTFPSNAAGVSQQRLSLLMAPEAKKQTEPVDQYWEKCQNLMKFVTNIGDEAVEAIEHLQVGLHGVRDDGLPGEFLPKYDWPLHRFQNMVVNGLHGASLDEGIMPQLSDAFERAL